MKNTIKKRTTAGICLLLSCALLAACSPGSGKISDKGTAASLGTSSKTTVSMAPENLTPEYKSDDPLVKVFRKAELQADFKKIQYYIESIHPKLYSDKEALNRLFTENYEKITEGMTEWEFYRLLTPIVSKTNCGHTSIDHSSSFAEKIQDNGTFFPIYLRFIEGKAFVYKNGLNKEIPIGAEIESINGNSMGDILSLMMANISADGQNETRKLYFLERAFDYFYSDFIESVDTFNVTFKKTKSAQSQTIKVTAKTNKAIDEANGLAWADESVPYSSSYKKDYAILKMISFYPEGQYSLSDYKEFIDGFFQKVKEKKISNIILDVRGNGGGDPYVTSYLFSYLAKTEQPYFSKEAIDYYVGLKNPVPFAKNRFKGNLYTLMDGGSFSSTGHLLALLKYQRVGTLIGQESGGSFACTDSSQNFVLPNTKIQLRTSTKVWKVAVEGLTPGRGIMPDYEVVPAMEDYIGEKDVVLEFAEKLIEKKK